MPGAIYQPEDPNPGLVPLPSMNAPTAGFQAAAQAGQAMVGLGAEADMVARRMAYARDVTNRTEAETQAALFDAGMRQKFSNDPDWRNAPSNFAQAYNEGMGEILSKANAGLSPEGQAQLRYRTTLMGISAGNEVQQRAHLLEGQSNVANWQTQSQALGQNYLKAGSDVERGAIQQQGLTAIDGLASAGWINPETAAREKQAFAQGLQESRARQVMQTDPAGAKAALANDSGQFPMIPPERRIALQNGAQAAVDATGALKLSILGKTNPPAAMAAIGAIDPSDRSSAQLIFDKGVIQQESGGNAAVGTNYAGASGIAQLEPGTARAAAQRLGMWDVARLNDADMRKAMADPGNVAINKALGFNEFQHQLQRYGGNVPLALAGYNAGPRVADAMQAEAKQKFGDNATPEQIASLAPSAETRAYIPAVYKHLGAPLDAFGLTGNAFLRGQENVLDVGRQEQRQQSRLIERGAALAWDSDPVVHTMQAGYPVDPQAWADMRQAQGAAAAQGSPEAAQRLRQMDLAEQLGPVMRMAYQMPPAQLGAAIAAEQQRMQASPGVSDFEVKRLEALQQVQHTTDAMLKTNPVGLGARAGMYQTTPVLPALSGTPALGDALAARGAQAQQAASAYGGALLPLQPDEEQAWKQAWNAMPPTGKAELAATAAQAFKSQPAYEAFMGQVVGKNDRLEMVAGQIGGQDPALAQKILTGAEMLKDKGLETRVKSVQEAMTQTIPVGLFPSTMVNSDLSEAALANYAASKGAQHALIDKDDAAGIKQAVEEISGPIVRLNGRDTPIAPGVSPAAVTHALSSLTADDFKPFGGLQPDLDPGWVGNNAQLVPLGLADKHYAVQVQGRPVFTAKGAPLVVDLGQMAAMGQAKGAAAQGGAEAASLARYRIGGPTGQAGLSPSPLLLGGGPGPPPADASPAPGPAPSGPTEIHIHQSGPGGVHIIDLGHPPAASPTGIVGRAFGEDQ